MRRHERAEAFPGVAEAVESVLTQLAGNEEFAKAVAAREIDRLIVAGTLIPAERLQLAPGLTLVDAEEHQALRLAVDELIEALSTKPTTKEDHQSVLKAVRSAVEKVAPIVRPPEPEPEPEPEPDPKPQAEDEPGESVPEAGTEPSEPASENEEEPAPLPRGWPEGYPPPDQNPPCQECGTPLESHEQALLSWTRFRAVLCPTDFAARNTT